MLLNIEQRIGVDRPGPITMQSVLVCDGDLPIYRLTASGYFL